MVGASELGLELADMLAVAPAATSISSICGQVKFPQGE